MTDAVLEPRPWPDSTGEERPRDRLLLALFAAALLHALLILGLRFAAPRADAPPVPTLEVLLVAPGTDTATPDPAAAYLAQRSQRGTGTTLERQRASLPEATANVLENRGDAQGRDVVEDVPAAEPGATRVVAVPNHGAEITLLEDGRELTEPAAIPLQSRPLPRIGVNAQAADEQLRLRGADAADGRLLADTRRSAIAAYLDAWKRRVERTGSLHFPEAARARGADANPVLEVAVRADGRLREVVVRRTSGRRELDRAAVNIVRRAAPFEPFPRAMRAHYPELRFAYEWQFVAAGPSRLDAGARDAGTGGP